MPSQTNELALETAIEKALCGTTTEENFAKVSNFGNVIFRNHFRHDGDI